MEVTLRADDLRVCTLEERLGAILATPVYIVRFNHTELISAGFPLARAYVQQSAKTADQPTSEVTTRLLKEGAGSPFLIVMQSGPPPGQPDRLPLANAPDLSQQ